MSTFKSKEDVMVYYKEDSARLEQVLDFTKKGKLWRRRTVDLPLEHSAVVAVKHGIAKKVLLIDVSFLALRESQLHFYDM